MNASKQYDGIKPYFLLASSKKKRPIKVTKTSKNIFIIFVYIISITTHMGWGKYYICYLNYRQVQYDEI